MFHVAEYRRKGKRLSDYLPWAGLIHPRVILNKDGSFLAAYRFRGPDLDSCSDHELIAVRARMNNALRRLGSRWCLLGFVSLGLKAGNSTLSQQQFYNPGQVVATGWSGTWRMLQAATNLTGVRATFVNLPQILIMELAAIVYFVTFALLAFQIFLALVQFKAGTLASFVLLPMALLSKTVFLAERPIGWVFASGIRLMVLALVMSLGLNLVQSVAAVPAQDLTIRQTVAAALGAVSLLLLARMATSMSHDLVSGAPSLGADGMGGVAAAGGAAAFAMGTAIDAAKKAPQIGRLVRWGAMKAASLVPGGGSVAVAGEAAGKAAAVALKTVEGSK